MTDTNPENSESRDNDSFLGVGHLEGRLGEHTARGGIVTLVSQAVLFILNLISTAILARLLTLDDHGLILMVMPVIGFIYLFKDLGLSHATIQKAEITHRQITMLFWINCAFSAVLMVLTIVSAPFIALFYNRPQLTMITIALSLGFFMSGMTVQHQALLRRQMRFFTLAMINLAAAAAGITAGVAAAVAGAEYWALVIKMLVTTLVTEGGVWLACGWRPGLPRFGSGAMSMITFGAHIMGFNILNYCSTYIANVLLGKTGGAQEVALYGRARQLLLLPIQQVNAPLSSVAISSLSRLVDDGDAYRAMYFRVAGKIAMISIPCVAALISVSDWVVLIILGSQWEAAARIFALLGVAALFLPVGNTSGWLMISQGRTQEFFRWGIVDASLTVAGIAAGLPWGVRGVAAGYAAVTVLLKFPLLFRLIGKSGPVRARDIYRLMAIPFLASAIIMLTLHLWRSAADPDMWFGTIAAGIVTVVVSPLVYLLFPSTRKEMKDFRYVVDIMFRGRANDISKRTNGAE